MTSQTSTENITLAARKAYQASQLIPSSERINALHAIKTALEANKEQILAANKLDVDAARVEVEGGRMSDSLFKRLDLNKGDKWDSMLQGLEDVANLPDPTGKLTYAKELDDGLELYRVSCPIGVLLVIFEARPEVVVNIASLAIKSGNAAILKGGKESTHSATELAKAIQSGLSATSLPSTYIQAISTRAEVSSLLACTQYIDLVIPRGSNELVSYIQSSTRIPVMGHADGLCAVFVDETADKDKAIRVVVDSKVDYPAACNAAETLLLHQSIVTSLWPSIAHELASRSVTLLCDDVSIRALTKASQTWSPEFAKHIAEAIPESFDTEHLSLTISVKVVESIEEAINHVNTHGSHHTDCIVTENQDNAKKWCSGIDSAGTFVNASTRFADGFRYGFGTEVGIATGRIHARGPVGLEGLCTYKYILKSKTSSGHIVGEFGSGKKQYTHLDLPRDQAPF